jgi:hypothetical protein
MIITVRVPPSVGSINHVIAHTDGGFYKAEILGVEAELTEKEKLLSKVFRLQFSQDFKEVMATIINKLYKD